MAFAILNKFLNQGHERSVEAKKNILGLLLLKGVSIIISFVLVPLTINYVNPVQYGIWLTLSSMVAWISFFDIGFTQGLRNKFTEAKALNNIELARSYVATAYFFITLIFSILWVILLIVNCYFINWTHVINGITNNEEIVKLVAIIITFFCSQFIFKIINTLLIADQKPALSSLIDLLGQLLSIGSIFLLTKFTTGSIIYLGLTLCLSPTIVIIIANILLFKTKYSYVRPAIKYVRKDQIKDIVNLGLKFFVLQIASVVQFQTTLFLIAHYFDPLQVTTFNIAFKFFGALQMGFAILITPLWSNVTEAYHKNEFEWIKKAVNRYLLILIPFLLMGVIMLVFNKEFYRLWIGPSITIPFSISLLCLIFFCVGMFGSIFVYTLNGISALKLQFNTSIITSISFVIFSIVCVNYLKWGVDSIIIASIVSNIFAYFIGPLQYYKLIVKRSNNTIWSK